MTTFSDRQPLCYFLDTNVQRNRQLSKTCKIKTENYKILAFATEGMLFSSLILNDFRLNKTIHHNKCYEFQCSTHQLSHLPPEHCELKLSQR